MKVKKTKETKYIITNNGKYFSMHKGWVDNESDATKFDTKEIARHIKDMEEAVLK